MYRLSYMRIYSCCLLAKQGLVVLYNMFPLFAPNPRCAVGFPLLSGLGGQFFPKLQVAGRRGTSEALMGFSSRSVILTTRPYPMLKLFKTVLNRQKA